MEMMNKWVYFCFNYPYDFIEQIWSGEYICDHLKGKFQMYYDLVGCTGVMNKFYANLDKTNQRRLLQWVIDNYNDEQKLSRKEGA